MRGAALFSFRPGVSISTLWHHLLPRCLGMTCRSYSGCDGRRGAAIAVVPRAGLRLRGYDFEFRLPQPNWLGSLGQSARWNAERVVENQRVRWRSPAGSSGVAVRRAYENETLGRTGRWLASACLETHAGSDRHRRSARARLAVCGGAPRARLAANRISSVTRDSA